MFDGNLALALSKSATDICREVITHPGAWYGSSVGGKDGLLYRLSDRHLDAFDSILAKTRALAPQSVTRREFDHPAVNALLADIRELLFEGRGVAVIHGLTPDRYSQEDLERLCWGFGTHWGIAAVQSTSGDRLGRVRKEAINVKNRGYQTDKELTFHSDAYELLGLMCLQDAESGGYTRLVSALAVHNEILKARPDLLEPLYRGFPYAMTEALGTLDPVTSMSIPVFSSVEGKVSCMFLPKYMRAAADILGTKLPADLEEGLAFFRQTAARDDLCLQFLLEPGEMLVCNNFTNLHARTEFKDGDVKKRHFLRLWLSVPNGRPVHPGLLERGTAYERLYRKTIAENGAIAMRA
jgi:Taurine catabolism dioxygenase TauD, TfdA family